MRHSETRFRKETVIKNAAPGLMRVEVEKTRRAGRIGEKCGLFHVPRVLDYNEEKGSVVFERIPEIKSIKSVLKEKGEWQPLLKKLGRSLAIIHKELILPDDMIIELPAKFRLAGTEVFLHGDFDGHNICIDSSDNSLIILDWQMTPLYGGRATYGSRYFDLMWFANNLIWSSTADYVFNNPIPKVTNILFQSYFNEAKIAYNAEAAVKYSKRFFNVRLPDEWQRLTLKRRCILPYSKFLINRFINSLYSIQV